MSALPTSHPGDTVNIGPDGRFDIDRDLICTADSSGRFVSLNSAWEKVLGWNRHDLTVRPFLDFVHPDDRARTQLETERVGEVDYEIVDFENRFRTRDGRWRWLRWRARSDGELWFAVAFDVTEAKDAVDRIQRMIQAERLLAYGQPIKALRGSNGHHAELLARLQPLVPGGEVLLPREFIPEAERLGLIQIVDRWMTEQGLRIAEQGQCAQINVSARSLENEGFCREIAERIGAAGGLAERVVFEITETAAVEHIDAVRDFCERLAPLGCRFALDDFGTGYGSLTYLRTLPFHYLKIDADYVRCLPGAERDEAIVRGVVAFARELGLETVAEGVEQPETLQFLREIGVDHVQGFLIGRPQPLQG